jgi:FAD/FMN-containing dehydrogenase
MALIGGRMVTGAGDVVELDEETNGAMLPAARASLGVLGVFTSVRLRPLPAFRLRRRECARVWKSASPISTS